MYRILCNIYTAVQPHVGIKQFFPYLCAVGAAAYPPAWNDVYILCIIFIWTHILQYTVGATPSGCPLPCVRPLRLSYTNIFYILKRDTDSGVPFIIIPFYYFSGAEPSSTVVSSAVVSSAAFSSAALSSAAFSSTASVLSPAGATTSPFNAATAFLTFSLSSLVIPNRIFAASALVAETSGRNVPSS